MKREAIKTWESDGSMRPVVAGPLAEKVIMCAVTGPKIIGLLKPVIILYLLATYFLLISLLISNK